MPSRRWRSALVRQLIIWHPLAVTALAHTVQNPTEAAYARSDLFERRRRLMDDWAAYLDGERGSDDPPGG